MATNTVAQYANKQLDSALNPLLNALKEYMGLSTKGGFLFLIALAAKHPEKLMPEFQSGFNTDGAEFRDGTDVEYNAAIDVFIERYCAERHFKFADVRTDQGELDKCMNYYRDLANSMGKSLLNSDLMSYKKGVPEGEASDFVVIIAELFQGLKQESEPF
jgi:hypothetical protein